MDAPRRILVVDDHRAIREGLRLTLAEFGHGEIEEAPDAESAIQSILADPPDLTIVDLNLPGKSGLDLVAELQANGIQTTVVVLTGHGSIDSAVEATRRGVFDYLEKPVSPERLKAVVERGLEHTNMRREILRLRREMARSGRLDELVGRSPAMLQIYRLVDQVAPTNASVMITGESGTGKEVVARAIHRLSPRAARPLVAINCAAIPRELLESELFGHERGSFTGATAARTGCFEQAHGGSLLLDEIGDMPADLQSKLLRALENRSFRRVGGEREIQVDVRIIAATNANLDALVEERSLREDLFFRLNVFPIQVPSLRERQEDIPVLADHFLQLHLRENPSRVVGFSDAALRRMMVYSWPGNVRELRNVVQRAAILCPQEEIQPEHLPAGLRSGEPSVRPAGRGVFVPSGTGLDEAERAIILDTLRVCGGNKPRAAEVLGISLKTLYTRLNRYGAERSDPNRAAP